MNKQGDKGITWTDWSSNPLFVTSRATGKRGWHCTRVASGVSASGCDFCYAATLNMGRFGTGLDFLQENDALVEWHLNEDELRAWTRKAPARVFPFDMTDIFHKGIPEEMVVRCFAAMLLSPRMTFQVLTKRPAVMRRLFSSREWWERVVVQAIEYAAAWRLPKPSVDLLPYPLPNVWAGTTVATMQDARARLPLLLGTPASVRWVSLEPQLEFVSLRLWLEEGWMAGGDPVRLDWIVQGGESGSWRPFEEAWARSMRDECAELGVAYFLKQMGQVWARDKGLVGVDTHGKKLLHFPEDLRVQQYPFGRVQQYPPLGGLEIGGAA